MCSSFENICRVRLEREFSGGNHLCDFVELSCFHRGDWNWAFDSGTHPCVTQLGRHVDFPMWKIIQFSSYFRMAKNDCYKCYIVMIYIQIWFKYSNIHQRHCVSYVALLHHPQVLGKISEKNLKESGLELEDHPWLDGWRELREAELRSCKKLKSVNSEWWCHFYGEFYMFNGEFCCKFHDFDDIICFSNEIDGY